jgi:phosphatidylglycerophosphate synthase
MLSKNNSINLFLLGCIPIRIIIALIPLYIDKKWLFYYSFILLSISVSFLYLYFTNSRENAFEAGGKTWWAKYRIIHGLFYLIAAFYAYFQNRNAWIPLAMDVIFGLILFIQKRFLNNIA